MIAGYPLQVHSYNANENNKKQRVDGHKVKIIPLCYSLIIIKREEQILVPPIRGLTIKFANSSR